MLKNNKRGMMEMMNKTELDYASMLWEFFWQY